MHPRRGGFVAVLLLALGAVAGCTSEPDTPVPSPTPEATATPAPSGVRVGVVLPPAGEISTAAAERAREVLAELAGRDPDIASLRTVVPDDGVFTPDVVGLLADDGYDLVCVLTESGARVSVDLAPRFPATRFCAAGVPGEDDPANVDLLAVADDELGFVLGAVAATSADGGEIALLRDDDRGDRAARRAGALAALADAEVAVDQAAAGASAVAALEEELEETDLAVVISDVSGPDATTLAEAADAEVIVPVASTARQDGIEAPLLTWEVRADVVVEVAVRRLLDGDDGPSARLGLAEGVFTLVLAEDAPGAVRDRFQEVLDGLAGGTIDPSSPTGTGGDDEE